MRTLSENFSDLSQIFGAGRQKGFLNVNKNILKISLFLKKKSK